MQETGQGKEEAEWGGNGFLLALWFRLPWDWWPTLRTGGDGREM